MKKCCLKTKINYNTWSNCKMHLNAKVMQLNVHHMFTNFDILICCNSSQYSIMSALQISSKSDQKVHFKLAANVSLLCVQSIATSAFISLCHLPPCDIVIVAFGSRVAICYVIGSHKMLFVILLCFDLHIALTSHNYPPPTLMSHTLH